MATLPTSGYPSIFEAIVHPRANAQQRVEALQSLVFVFFDVHGQSETTPENRGAIGGEYDNDVGCQWVTIRKTTHARDESNIVIVVQCCCGIPKRKGGHHSRHPAQLQGQQQEG